MKREHPSKLASRVRRWFRKASSDKVTEQVCVDRPFRQGDKVDSFGVGYTVLADEINGCIDVSGRLATYRNRPAKNYTLTFRPYDLVRDERGEACEAAEEAWDALPQRIRQSHDPGDWEDGFVAGYLARAAKGLIS